MGNSDFTRRAKADFWRSGQSLMELLIGLGVISIMVGASTYALVSVMRTSDVTEQNQSAGLIGNSLLESAFTLAESNWNSIYNLRKTTSNHYFLARSSTTTPTPVAGDESVLEQDILNGLVGHWKLDEAAGTWAYDSSGNGNLGTLTNIPDINSGLVGYWKFDEESGTTATDLSGGGHNGTLVNSPTRNTYKDCKFGGCLGFNGSSSYIDAGSGISDSLESSGSIGMWIFPNALGGIFSRSVNGSWTGERIALNFYATGSKLDMTFSNGTSYWRHLSNSSVQLGRWTHIVITWNGTTVNFYFNGVLDRSVAQGGIPEITGVKTWIGRTEGLTPDFFNGRMDDFRIYNRALSDTEISRLYYMNNCRVGGCLAFDGTNQYVDVVNNSNLKITGDLTASAWVNIGGTISGNGDVVFGMDYAYSANSGYMFMIYPGNRLYFSTGSTQFYVDYNPYLNGWHNIAYTKSGATGKIYIDGVLQGTGTSANPIPYNNNYNFYIGERKDSPLSYIFKGLVDDVRVYNRAFSDAEISQLYNSPIYTRYFYVDNVNRKACGSGEITADAVTSCNGSANDVGEDPASQKITVGTIWNMKGVNEVLSNSIYVTRWINSAASQTSWAGSSGLSSAVSDFSTNYFSSNSIEVTASGTIKATGTIANNPVPTTTGISPTSKTAGDPQFTLTVNGTNFISGSVVKFSGTSKTTTYASSTQLTAVIPAADIASAGAFNVTVYNSAPGGGTSNAQTFTVGASGLAGWTYKKTVTVTENSGGALTDFPLLVTTDTASLISAGKMKSDCSDIRFTDSDMLTLLSNYLESGCNTAATKVWVKIPSISASSQKTLYFYYGNASASSISDITTVFDVVNYTNLATYMGGRNEFWLYMQGSGVYFLKIKENGTQFVPGQDVKYVWTKLSATAHWDNPAGTSWYGTESGWDDYGTGVWNYWAAADCFTCYTHMLQFVGNGRSGYYSYGSTYHADFVDLTGAVTFLGNEGGSSSLTGPLITYRIKHVATDPTYSLGAEQ